MMSTLMSFKTHVITGKKVMNIDEDENLATTTFTKDFALLSIALITGNQKTSYQIYSVAILVYWKCHNSSGCQETKFNITAQGN